MLPAGRFSKNVIIPCVSAAAKTNRGKPGEQKKKQKKHQPSGGQGTGCAQKLVKVSHAPYCNPHLLLQSTVSFRLQVFLELPWPYYVSPT